MVNQLDKLLSLSQNTIYPGLFVDSLHVSHMAFLIFVIFFTTSQRTKGQPAYATVCFSSTHSIHDRIFFYIVQTSYKYIYSDARKYGVFMCCFAFTLIRQSYANNHTSKLLIKPHTVFVNEYVWLLIMVL